MSTREQDDLPYRSAFTEIAPVASVTTDEVNYDTLKHVRDLMVEAVNNLSKNFNAFEVLKQGNTKQDAALDLVRQIEVKQGVYDVLAPLLEEVNSAMRTIDNKYKSR